MLKLENTCEECPTQQTCEQLKQALHITKNGIEKAASVNIQEYHEVLEYTQKNQWHYPHNTQTCRFQKSNVEVLSLVEKLVANESPNFRRIINSAPLIVRKEQDLSFAVQNMLTSRSDCCLVVDRNEYLVGIITARDILRIMTSDEIKNPLEFTISHTMTSPVECIQLENLHEEVFQVYRQMSLKHFPIVRKKESPKIEHIVGVLSSKSIGNHFLNTHKLKK